MKKNIKFLKALSKKANNNNFLTNFLMVLFAKNKEKLDIKTMKIEEFIEKIQSQFSIFLWNFFKKTTNSMISW